MWIDPSGYKAHKNKNPKTNNGKSKDGTYGQTKAKGKYAHHMPANSASQLSKKRGLAIQMDPKEHRKTASYEGNKKSKQAAYRKKQEQLIKQGKFDDAFLMDVDDIQSKFGNKYDDAIWEAIDVIPNVY